MRKVAVLAMLLAVIGVGLYSQVENRRMKDYEAQLLAIAEQIHRKAQAGLDDPTKVAALYEYMGGEALETLRALPKADLPFRQAQFARLVGTCQAASEGFKQDPLSASNTKLLEGLQRDMLDVADCLKRGLVSADQPW